jgi:HrpA-like RNA helicase
VKECAAVAQRIHEQEPPGDILIFLTGMEEVDRCCDLLKVPVSLRQCNICYLRITYLLVLRSAVKVMIREERLDWLLI